MDATETNNVPVKSEGDENTVTKTVSPLRQFAGDLWKYLYWYLRTCSEDGKNLLDEWKDIAILLALFNVQLTVKNRIEKTKKGFENYVFFVANGKPREMSALRLPVFLAKPFFSLPDKHRLLVSRSFEENKELLMVPVPFTRENFSNKDCLDEALRLVESLRDKI